MDLLIILARISTHSNVSRKVMRGRQSKYRTIAHSVYSFDTVTSKFLHVSQGTARAQHPMSIQTAQPPTLRVYALYFAFLLSKFVPFSASLWDFSRFSQFLFHKHAESNVYTFYFIVKSVEVRVGWYPLKILKSGETLWKHLSVSIREPFGELRKDALPARK